MILHTENIKKVVGVTVETDESAGFFVLCVEVVTTGNVRKVVRFPHVQADMLRVGLTGEFESMSDDARKQSFNASLMAARKGNQ